MKEALGRIHKAGYVHGDISLGSFCERDDGMVFVVDLENCRACVNKSEINAETLLIDCL
jgi:tRNA A-37 threonylcarbamoyl transferase component Bud32